MVVTLFAGCSAHDPDPLNWQIEAKNPETLGEWMQKTMPLLPSELQEDLAESYTNIVARTPGSDASSDEQINNPVCLRLNHRTLREVILEGLQIGRDALNTRIDLLRNSEIALLKQEEDAPPDRLVIYEKRLKEYRAALEYANKELVPLQKRIDMLLATRPKE
ncbi:MAG TPA: hypothetical protein VHD32_19135 [Candidatus Didemnitutus sp.]|nr:hypothetical protein [Candidatus Didemnitutus sp.]